MDSMFTMCIERVQFLLALAFVGLMATISCCVGVSRVGVDPFKVNLMISTNPIVQTFSGSVRIERKGTMFNQFQIREVSC